MRAATLAKKRRPQKGKRVIIVYKNKKHVKLDGVSVSIFTQAKSQEWSRGEAELYKYGNYVSSFPLWGKKKHIIIFPFGWTAAQTVSMETSQIFC